MKIIYHSRDLDGYCSGAICKRKYPDAELIGYDYGQPFPWDKIPQGEEVIMVDVSLPMPDMYALFNHTHGNFVWIDHHASAINDFEVYFPIAGEYPCAVLEDGISACEGAWKYLFPDEDMPNVVLWLGEYDTWRNSDKDRWDNKILPFQYGMRLGITNADNFPQEILNSESEIGNAIFTKALLQGHTLLDYQKEQNDRIMKGSFVREFKGLRALCCNGAGFNSQAFESVWNEAEHDLMMPFRFDGLFWNFSMYTTKEIDLSVIAKEFDGGGHKKACGFRLPYFPDWLKDQTNAGN